MIPGLGAVASSRYHSVLTFSFSGREQDAMRLPQGSDAGHLSCIYYTAGGVKGNDCLAEISV